jgi:hypothetical protein
LSLGGKKEAEEEEAEQIETQKLCKEIVIIYMTAEQIETQKLWKEIVMIHMILRIESGRVKGRRRRTTTTN